MKSDDEFDYQVKGRMLWARVPFIIPGPMTRREAMAKGHERAGRAKVVVILRAARTGINAGKYFFHHIIK